MKLSKEQVEVVKESARRSAKWADENGYMGDYTDFSSPVPNTNHNGLADGDWEALDGRLLEAGMKKLDDYYKEDSPFYQQISDLFQDEFAVVSCQIAEACGWVDPDYDDYGDGEGE